MSHYCSGFRLWLWPWPWLWLGPSLGNLPSETSTEALARDQMCRCLWQWSLPLRRACRSQSDAVESEISTADRSRVHSRLSPSVLAVHSHGLGSSASPNGNVLRLGRTSDGSILHIARHVARRASCSFVLGVELDLAVLFILDISPASLVGLLMRAPRGSRILYPSPGAFDFTRRTRSPLAFP
jgi:hypothetical protein